MNKVMQKLMQQSMVEYQFTTRFSPEKFAELLVRECAQLVKSAQLTEDGHTWRSADRVVLEHFGVDNE
jgi:hypothetical protein